MKVMVYTRPRIKTFFHELVERVDCFDEVTFMSDHYGEESVWIMSYYYQAQNDLRQNRAQVPHDFDFGNIVLRCRYLRSLDQETAIEKAKAMTLGIERLVQDYQPDVIFGMVMDSFVLDIIDQVMRTRNSQYIGFLNNMINGYSRITARGELIQLNQPNEEMIEQALQNLKAEKYIPNMQKDFMWNISPWSMFFSKYLKEKAKIIYYSLKKIIDKDPDNFYYNTVAAKSCMSCRRINQIFFREFEDKNWLNKIAEAKSVGKYIVYMPLQFYPECSIDYWGTHHDFLNFYEVVREILANQYQEIIFLVKEHPSAMGLRQAQFYKQFARNDAVILTPFDVASNEIISKADMVLTWTGSVGVEAIMRSKPLITFGHAYYDPGYGILHLESKDQLRKLESILVDYMRKPQVDSLQLQRDVVTYMLKGLIPGYVFPLDYKTKKNPVNPTQIAQLASGIEAVASYVKEKGAYNVRQCGV